MILTLTRSYRARWRATWAAAAQEVLLSRRMARRWPAKA
jgi:hypothetical protein